MRRSRFRHNDSPAHRTSLHRVGYQHSRVPRRFSTIGITALHGFCSIFFEPMCFFGGEYKSPELFLRKESPFNMGFHSCAINSFQLIACLFSSLSVRLALLFPGGKKSATDKLPCFFVTPRSNLTLGFCNGATNCSTGFGGCREVMAYCKAVCHIMLCKLRSAPAFRAGHPGISFSPSS